MGKFDKWVTMANKPQLTNDSDGFYDPLTPSGAWASIQPLPPAGDDRTVQSLVSMRFHPQVTMDTRITYARNGTTTQLYVRGFQNIDYDDTTLQLLCEEVVP